MLHFPDRDKDNSCPRRLGETLAKNSAAPSMKKEMQRKCSYHGGDLSFRVWTRLFALEDMVTGVSQLAQG